MLTVPIWRPLSGPPPCSHFTANNNKRKMLSIKEKLRPVTDSSSGRVALLLPDQNVFSHYVFELKCRIEIQKDVFRNT